MPNDPLDQLQAQLQAEIEMLLIRVQASGKKFDKLSPDEQRAHLAKYKAGYAQMMEQVQRLIDSWNDFAQRRSQPD